MRGTLSCSATLLLFIIGNIPIFPVKSMTGERREFTERKKEGHHVCRTRSLHPGVEAL
jgi:hypothetical protein